MGWLNRQRDSKAEDLYGAVLAVTTPDLEVVGPISPTIGDTAWSVLCAEVASSDLRCFARDGHAGEPSGYPTAERHPLDGLVAATSGIAERWGTFPVEVRSASGKDAKLGDDIASTMIACGPRTTIQRHLGLPVVVGSRDPSIQCKRIEDAIGLGPANAPPGAIAAVRSVPLIVDLRGGVLSYKSIQLALPSVFSLPPPGTGLAINHVALSIDLSGKVRDWKIAGFTAQSHTFRFDDRSDPAGSLFARPRAGVPKSKSARLTPLPPPPSAKKLDIRERLRILLMPPIEDLLADPQLCLPLPPFPYQMQGIGWLMQRENALLADEMGLGKTMQAIVAARLLWKQKKVSRILIVCPKTLIGNWRTEIAKWWPQMPEYVYVCESDRQWFLRLALDKMVIKIINYEALAREVDWIEKTPFSHDMIVLDEAQRIKNPSSATARATKMLKSTYRWALTGTPLENRIEDVISIFEFVSPGLLQRDDQAHVKSRIGDYMLRRRTDEVLQDLPALIDLDVALDLSPRQRQAYDQAEREGVVKLNEKGDTITVTHVFQLINSLRQICNFDVSGDSAKLELLREDLEEITASGRKALVFSQFTHDRGIERINDGLSEHSPLMLHGGVAVHRRDDVVQEFNRNASRQVLLLNYAVGGVGLNLQKANYVFLFDRWWNPAVEDQAVKRAHRIGQNDRVFVKRFVCNETIEERILLKLREKRALFDAVIDDARPEKAMGLTEEEIMGLFPGLTVRPKRKHAPDHIPTLVMDNLDSQQFEVLVSKIYAAQGYGVTLTGKTADGGIDLVAERIDSPGRELVIVQCKHWKGPVGAPVVRDLWGAVNGDHRFTRGDLIASSTFTKQARDFGAGKRITFIDGASIREMAKRHGIAKFQDPQ